MKKVTSFTAHQTAEGERVAFTYSIIDDGGNVTKSNAKASTIVLDEEVLAHIQAIEEFCYSKIPE